MKEYIVLCYLILCILVLAFILEFIFWEIYFKKILSSNLFAEIAHKFLLINTSILNNFLRIFISEFTFLFYIVFFDFI